MGAEIIVDSLEQMCDLMCGAPEEDEEVNDMMGMPSVERLTEFDEVRQCYVIRPDAEQGEHIQRLGFYEDKDTVNVRNYGAGWDGEGLQPECGCCGRPVGFSYRFCPHCGQRVSD